jgi:hypothetical protein
LGHGYEPRQVSGEPVLEGDSRRGKGAQSPEQERNRGGCQPVGGFQEEENLSEGILVDEPLRSRCEKGFPENQSHGPAWDAEDPPHTSDHQSRSITAADGRQSFLQDPGCLDVGRTMEGGNTRGSAMTGRAHGEGSTRAGKTGTRHDLFTTHLC